MSRGPDLLADCSSCFGLCCVALPFSASADFAVDKAAGEPCGNLQSDFRCGIHPSLRSRGFSGCTVYDCFGAGQQVSQITYGGVDWRTAPDTSAEMFQVFPIVRQLHELLFYLGQVLAMGAAAELHDAIRGAVVLTQDLAASSPTTILALDLPAHRDAVDVLLRRGSELARAELRAENHGGKTATVKKRGRQRAVGKNLARADLVGADLARADLIGADLAGANLRGVDLRGAYLIGANLRAADLRLADLIGADLRAADLCGADLSTSLFLTQFQVNAAKGDEDTRLPPGLTQPGYWSS